MQGRKLTAQNGSLPGLSCYSTYSELLEIKSAKFGELKAEKTSCRPITCLQDIIWPSAQCAQRLRHFYLNAHLRCHRFIRLCLRGSGIPTPSDKPFFVIALLIFETLYCLTLQIFLVPKVLSVFNVNHFWPFVVFNEMK